MMTTQMKVELYKRGTAKYMQVRDVIYRRILSGEYPAGSAIHSEPELVNIFGVSKMTIRQALTELEKEGLLYRKQGVGTFVNDPNTAGAQQITVILPGAAEVSNHGSMFKIMHGILEEAYHSGIRLSIYAAEQCDLKKIPPHGGGLIFPCPTQQLVKEAEGMARSNYRVVVINREPDCPELSYFSTDHRRSAEIGTEFLIGRGRKRLALVSARTSPHLLVRCAGWRDTLKRHGLKGRELFLEAKQFIDEEYAKKTLAWADAALITEGRLLPQTLKILEVLGRRIPSDMELVTFNKIEQKVPSGEFVHELLESLEEYGKSAVRQIAGRKAPAGRSFEAFLNIKQPATL